MSEGTPIYLDAIGKPVTERDVGGTAGFCSWRRLAEVFSAAGEVRPTERLVAYRINSDGITFFVQQRSEKT